MKMEKESNFLRRGISIGFVILILIVLYNGFKTPVAPGISEKGELRNSEVEFIYDLTYEKDKSILHEKNIFPKIMEMVEEAQEFIVIDMFLFNDEYDRKYQYDNISGELTNKLILQKEKYPEIKIVFITDEINTFYGSYSSEYLDKLKENDIQVVITDLEKIRDPNPLYSGVWRLLFKNLNTSGKGILPNPFSPDSPKGTIPSYLKILNMKANHRKVVITEKEALVTSFNPHDASSNHSNIALVVRGEIINDLLKTENAVLSFSGEETFDFKVDYPVDTSAQGQVLTEGKIKEELIYEIEKTKKGEKIQIAMFYLADIQIIDELIKASDRGVDIKIILDANKDAFGREKNGIPNRPVAYKLVNESNGEIAVKWYSTHGEQFHSKITIFLKDDELIVIGGSANLTRRNLDDYNLETNLKIILERDNPEAIKIEDYFKRIWNNNDTEYTLDFAAYEEKSILKKILYYIQEITGLSSF